MSPTTLAPPPTASSGPVSTTPVPVSTTPVTVSTTPVPVSTTPVPVSTTPVPVSTTPVPGTVSTPAGVNDSVCTTERCHFLAQWLRQKLDFNVDPCEDFYRYVCSAYDWPAPNVFEETARSMISIIIAAAYAARVPATGQSAWQKAVGIFQACLSLAESKQSETGDLVGWMVSVHLDLGNLTALKTIDPLDMMVRCSLDFGVRAILGILFHNTVAENNKRTILMGYSKEDAVWQQSLRETPKNRSFPIYVTILRMYGLDQSGAENLATSISEIEAKIDGIVLEKSKTANTSVLGPIRGMGQRTAPYITGAEWISAFAKHTNNTYHGDDRIFYKYALLDVLVELFESVDAAGINSQIAWSVFRQLAANTEPKVLFAAGSPTIVCYLRVVKVMKPAFASKFLNFVTNRKTVKTATSIVRNIRKALRTALNTSSWVEGAVRDVALKKLSKMKYHVGSPGQRLDPANIDDYYDTVPDVDTKRFFKAYRAALQASAHRSWSDQKSRIYDETIVNGYYVREVNTVLIPAGILQNPYFNAEGPAALNYGGIGMVSSPWIMGHEIMHGYDVGGTMYDDESMQRAWATPEFLKNYTERTLCVRNSHKAAAAMKARQAVINDTADSENLADLVGTVLAHAAFASLPPVERNVTLPGLNPDG
ncbi:hypothetical protein MTO96_023453 [Rhipicephalus appendiculatus]